MKTAAFYLLLLVPAAATAQEAFDPGVPQPQVAAGYYAGSEKVVYHVTEETDARGYLAILGSVRNHHNALISAGAKPDIKIVINGGGIRILTLAQELEFEATARLPGAIMDAKERGVDIEVCYNTLTGFKIKLSQLFDTRPEDIVQAGVAEVARLQRMGYAMIKP